MEDDVILKTIARVLVPFLELFGLYVTVHGDLTPGGGFQGGVLLGIGVIVYTLAFGVSDTRKKITSGIRDTLSSLGVLIYVMIGILCILFGGHFLEYSAIPLPVGMAERNALLILGIELGVGITVMSVVISIFLDLNQEER
ncbi:MAG: Na(+)/H(+) antiporter subunit B [Candidatus Thermoplasmatota archaeon]|nr:Na(+)/H(+) antiporter subunit B [Candidatus Thermoplasmatota archaeon]